MPTPNYARMIEIIRDGDVVYYGANKSVLYKVTRTKIAKFLAVESGTGRRIEGRLEFAHKADNPEDFEDTEETTAPAPSLALGMAVRYKNPSPNMRGVFVTLNKTSTGWRLARLGGSDGMRYYHSVEANRLEPVDAINHADWDSAV